MEWLRMKHYQIVDKCEGCPQIVFNANMIKICDLYPRPEEIWKAGDCSAKIRHSEFPPDYWSDFGEDL